MRVVGSHWLVHSVPTEAEGTSPQDEESYPTGGIRDPFFSDGPLDSLRKARVEDWTFPRVTRRCVDGGSLRDVYRSTSVSYK